MGSVESSNAVFCYCEDLLSILRRKIGLFLTTPKMNLHLIVFPLCKQQRIFQVIFLSWIHGLGRKSSITLFPFHSAFHWEKRLLLVSSTVPPSSSLSCCFEANLCGSECFLHGKPEYPPNLMRYRLLSKSDPYKHKSSLALVFYYKDSC